MGRGEVLESGPCLPCGLSSLGPGAPMPEPQDTRGRWPWVASWACWSQGIWWVSSCSPAQAGSFAGGLRSLSQRGPLAGPPSRCRTSRQGPCPARRVSRCLFSFLVHRTKPTHTTVNCWFCSQDTVVPYGNRNCWDCPHCEQYNGFQEVRPPRCLARPWGRPPPHRPAPLL